ncbi:hypothetical protein BU251_06805 [Candidatus Velamenicoccus archaeovorus]|uniref:PilZ domain-containing protein n=1 Tax=Velamenicoccus archaeovorus TaxID=1930593 RepID=A0A410P5M6_VELA1|nr:hypothetical protein BU251_06805 [Candidatus Velamenicoccus archaeovorus]
MQGAKKEVIVADLFNRVADMENAWEERRRFRRLKVNCPVEYRFFNGNRYSQSITCDISEGGVSFLVDGPIDIGSHIYFHARLKNKPQELYGIARVQWSAQEPYSEKYKVGLEFVETGSILRPDISSFIQENKLPCYSS